MKMEAQWKIEEVIKEIQRALDDWDEHIEAGQQPVPIQDLDFWALKLKRAVEIQNKEVSQ